MDIVNTCSQHTIDSFNSLSGCGFRLIHCNIRSLRKNFDKLMEIISCVNCYFHVICLSETYLYVNQNYFPIPNYFFAGDCRSTKCGGVGIYVHSSLTLIDYLPVSLAGAEAVSVRLADVGEKPLLVTCVYRSPSSDIGRFLDDLESFLSIHPTCLDHIISGDINIDLFKAESEPYLDIINQYNYHCLIDLPTRITPTSQTCIDHILVNFNYSEISSGTLLKDTSDHFPVFAIIYKNNINPKLNTYKRLYKNLQVDKIRKDLLEVDWQELVYNIRDADTAYDNFVTKTLDVFNVWAPIKEFTPPKYRTNGWFNKELKIQISIKDKLFRKHKTYPYSPNLKKAYNKQRNKVSTLIKKAKSNYYCSIISTQNNSRKLWQIINKACGRNQNSCQIINKIVTSDSQAITDSKQIAHCFNTYFTNIGPQLASAIPHIQHQYESNYSPDDFESFEISTVHNSVVLSHLQSLNTNKAEGLDSIPAKLVQTCAIQLSFPLTYIFNLCIKSSTVPKGMKVAKVLPLYKSKGSRSSCNSYRPISILPVFSKVFEKIINLQLQNHLQLHNIISPTQYGFQRNKGTLDALIQFANQSLAALNYSNVILGIFIDFSKAFDTIDHQILLKKLKAYNFSSKTVQLFESYLSNRTQCVKISNVYSCPLNIRCGVPQGSILGPTLFLLYINDLVKHSKIFNTILFADDTNLFFTSKNLNYDIDLINDSLDLVKKWCFSNKLTLNVDKTNYLIIKNPQNKFELCKEIKMDGSPIAHADYIKFLGITIDKSLNWSAHINNLRSQLHKTVGLIYYASGFLPVNVLLMLYNSLINSKIIYCLEAWGNAPNIYLNKILVIQKRIIKIIYHKKPTYHSAELFKRAKILPIHELYKLRICLLAHTSFYTHYNSIVSPYPTRHSQLSLPLPKSTSAAGHRQVSYQMSDAWNSLPREIRMIDSKVNFKMALKQHLLDSLI